MLSLYTSLLKTAGYTTANGEYGVINGDCCHGCCVGDATNANATGAGSPNMGGLSGAISKRSDNIGGAGIRTGAIGTGGNTGGRPKVSPMRANRLYGSAVSK